MIHLSGNSWLCVDNLYPKPHAIWQLEISHDGAHTWTPISTVAEPGRDLDNGDLVRLRDGTLLLTGRSVVLSQTPRARQSYHLPVYRSSDDGKSWTFASQIDTNETVNTPGQPSLGLWEPFLFLTSDGTVACAYSSEKRAADSVPYSQIVSERVSRDGGHTWGPELLMTAQIGGGNLRPGMPVVARMHNGQYMAVYEVIGLGDGDVYQKISQDGIHWPSGVGVRIPGQHHGPWVTALHDGRLVVTSCSNVIFL